jgi:hypothetical protein
VRRGVRFACACLLGAAVVALLPALGASGAEGTLPFLFSFGGEGEGAGQFNVAQGVAVDQAGDVYVADQKNQRVQKFSPWGVFDRAFGGGVDANTSANVCTAESKDKCQAGKAGESGGEFNNPLGVAVDDQEGPEQGDVYVVDFSNLRIEKFAPNGEFILAFGKGVDATTSGDVCTAASKDTCGKGKAGTMPGEFNWAAGTFIATGSTGTVYVGDENRVQEFEPTGKFKVQIRLKSAGNVPAGYVTALAVDSTGNIYAKASRLKGVREYGTTGQELAVFDEEASIITAIALDPNGDVFAADRGTHVIEYSAAGSQLADFAAEQLNGGDSAGIAANAQGTVYVAEEKAPFKVLVFGTLPPGEPPPVPPSIDSQSVTGLGVTSAMLGAQISPHFLKTTYYVEYGTDISYSLGKVPALPGETLGGGEVETDQPASVTLTGLAPGTAYHYRFVATSSAGTTDGPDQTFTTVEAGGLAGLPDARSFEQVSSQQKNGNEAGIELNSSASPAAAYATAVPSGEGIAYAQLGPSGQTASGTDLYSVSNRTAKGWETSAALPPEFLANGDFLGQEPLAFLPSADLSRFLFVATGPFTKENSRTFGDENLGLYRTRGNTVEPEWLSKPTFPLFSEAKPEPGKIGIEGIYPVGGSSPDLSTVYFTYFGTLVSEDKSRAPQVHPQDDKGPFGFYEWKEGKEGKGELHSAAVMPVGAPHAGEPSPYGAVPAVTGTSLGSTQRAPFPRFLLNEVSQDGSKAFFISPQPEHTPEATTPTELYVREQIEGGPPRTVLVSHDEAGMPAAGSGSGFDFETAVKPFRTKWAPEAYVYASPDGSRAFFQSMDKLTNSAPESGLKTYEADLHTTPGTATLTYLPGVEGPIITSSEDGSSFIFKNTTKQQIELWSGGLAPEVKVIGSYETPAEPEIEGAATTGGTVFVFNTNAVLKGVSREFNNKAAVAQSYRYDVASHTLSCVSCAPPEVEQRPVEALGSSSAHPRMIADEGRRVFFGTTAKLVSRDTNSVADVYEWEQVGTGSCHSEEREGGCVYLISSGTSNDPSFYLENDESGDNVFFSTKEGLVKGDGDESYDVYDARVNGGFPEEVPPPECESACRRGGGAPPLASPLTTALGPSGNLIGHVTTITAPPAPKPKPKPLTRAQKLAKALQACRHRPKRHRAACVRRARAQYASKRAGHGHHRSRK